MLNKNNILIIVPAILLSLSVISFAGPHTIAFGYRQHIDNSTFESLPFGDGDPSYTFAYEYHEGAGYWQIAIDYATDITGTNNINSVITPQLNLITEDHGLKFGIGMLQSYIDNEIEGSDWLNLYWQFISGFTVPLGSMRIDFLFYYAFKDWGEVNEFDFGDVDYAALLTYRF